MLAGPSLCWPSINNLNILGHTQNIFALGSFILCRLIDFHATLSGFNVYFIKPSYFLVYKANHFGCGM